MHQANIGKSTRSNPATYVKAYDAIRDLFADQPLAQQMGFTSQYFSFNADGGRCDECKGAGVITVEMQFMADLVLECEACHGHRFKHDILDVRYNGKNIDDVLNMTISEAISFFSADSAPLCRTIGLLHRTREAGAYPLHLRRADYRSSFPRHQPTARCLQRFD